MVNAWSLAYSIMNKTLDEDYPIMDEPRTYDEMVKDGYEMTGDGFWIPGPKRIAELEARRLNIDGQKKETMTDSRNKYHEDEILEDVKNYVSSTYNGHYTGTKHEFRNVQTLDLMASRDLASDFCQANILKYGSRYGSKDGRNKKDLLKVIHYAMLLLHFDEHYGKPSMTSGNIDHTMP